MEVLYILAVVIVLVVSIVAVLAPWFHDNTFQRFALGCTALGSVGEIHSLLLRDVSSTNSRTLLIMGLAVYGLGSLWNAYRFHRRTNQGLRNGQAYRS